MPTGPCWAQAHVHVSALGPHHMNELRARELDCNIEKGQASQELGKISVIGLWSP